MKQYVIDELRPEDHEKMRAHLDANYGVEGFEGLYWLPLDETEYDGFQSQHTECQPHYFALELTPQRLACELLVRTNKRVRCDCIRYATERQRNWLIRSIDAIVDQLGIII